MADFIYISDTLKYIYGGTYSTIRNITYKYIPATPLNYETSINYQYTGNYSPVLNDKIIGWRSPYTQIIANQYQPWHAIRNNPESTGQYLINSMAMFIDDANRYWNYNRKDLFLETADLSQPYQFGRVPIPDSVNIDKDFGKQLLVNGGFTFKGLSRYNLPYAWTDKFDYSNGTVECYNLDSVFGNGCVKMTAKQNTIAHISQSSDIIVPAGTNLTFSIYYKTYNAYGFSDSNIKPKLQLKVTEEDGTIRTYSTPIPLSTNGNWSRVWLTKKIQRTSGRIECAVDIKNTSSTQFILFADGFMLEQNDHPTKFEPSVIDNPDWMKSYGQFGRSPISVEVWKNHTLRSHSVSQSFLATGIESEKISLYGINNPNVFRSEYLIPTRLETIELTGLFSTTSITNKFYGINAYSGDTVAREVAWDIYTTGGLSNSLYRYVWPFRDEVLNVYTIADPDVNQGVVRIDSANNEFDLYSKYTVSNTDDFSRSFGYNLNIEAMTIKHDKIWAVCTESFSGSTNRILKIINPNTEQRKTYVESYVDLVISTGAGLTGSVTSVGFVNDNVDIMLLTLTGIHLSFSGQLVYPKKDYFYIDRDRRQVLTRELYSGSNDKVVIY